MDDLKNAEAGASLIDGLVKRVKKLEKGAELLDWLSKTSSAGK